MIQNFDQNFYWFVLSRTNGVGNKTLLEIFKRNRELDMSIGDFWKLPESEMTMLYGLKPPVIQSILNLKGSLKEIKSLY